MGPGIIIPLLLITIVVPVGIAWAKTNLKGTAAGGGDEPVVAPSARLTSNALRELPVPPWRVIYEIADEKLGGVGHVLIGPGGIFAMQTSLEPLPPAATGDPDPHDVARSAITRGPLDDALGRCAMASDRLVQIHWGVVEGPHAAAVETLPGTIAVDGRAIGTWVDSLPDDALTPAQVDLAWQTVLTSIGRPDPLA